MKQKVDSREKIYSIGFLFNLLWLIRVPIVAVSILLLINAFRVSGEQNIFLPCASTMCMLFFCYVVNDILDVEIDIISAPDRPLPSGRISVKSAKVICGIFGGLALMLAVLSKNIPFVLYIIIYAVMFWVYTRFLKRNWLVKNCVTALFFSSLTLVPVLFEKSSITKILPLFAVSFVFTLGREILMDIRDSVGDSVITGNKRMKKGLGWTVSSLLILTAFLLMEAIYFERFIPRYILIFAVCFAFAFLFWNKKKKIWLCTEIVKLWFLINLVCLLLGI